MMREVELIEKAEAYLSHAVDDYHNKGLSYWSLLKIFSGFTQRLIMQADAEYYIKGGK